MLKLPEPVLKMRPLKRTWLPTLIGVLLVAVGATGPAVAAEV